MNVGGGERQLHIWMQFLYVKLHVCQETPVFCELLQTYLALMMYLFNRCLTHLKHACVNLVKELCFARAGLRSHFYVQNRSSLFDMIFVLERLTQSSVFQAVCEMHHALCVPCYTNSLASCIKGEEQMEREVIHFYVKNAFRWWCGQMDFPSCSTLNRLYLLEGQVGTAESHPTSSPAGHLKVLWWMDACCIFWNHVQDFNKSSILTWNRRKNCGERRMIFQTPPTK